jgi:hypothetical protein
MKRVILAAGALMLGTSALAYAGSVDKPIDSSADATLTASTDKSLVSTDSIFSTTDKARMASWEKTFAPDKGELASADSKFSFASLDKDLQPLASTESDAKLMTAAAETGWTDTVDKPLLADGTLDKSRLADASSDKVVTATADDMSTGKIETASVDKTEYTGTGGPLEEVAPASGSVVQPSNANPEFDARGIPVISDAAFVPPGYNGNASGAMGGPEEGTSESYPPCTRERTDNCTQTYEVGGSGTIASRDETTTTAMGGPYEPVADSNELAMNGDGAIDVSKGETSDALVQTASADSATLADHNEFQGVGGPVEAQSGYPPCSPGPGDDRCIQLYEAGVTGAGN